MALLENSIIAAVATRWLGWQISCLLRQDAELWNFLLSLDFTTVFPKC